MNDEAKKLIQEQYSKLPSFLQKAIQSAHLHEQIESIGRKNQLHIDQIGALEDETIMLMMGFTDPAEFAGQLEKQLPVDKLKAVGVANDVGEEIMMPIRDSMKKFMEEGEAKGQAGTSAASTTAKETSVVMPSAAKAASVPTPPKPAPAPLAPVVTPPSPTTPAPGAKPAEMHAADLMLKEPTVSMPPKPAPPAPAPSPAIPAAPAGQAKVEAPKSAPYKADPYREPPE